MTRLKSSCHHPGGVNVAFADDTEHYVHAYIGHPIHNRSGTTLGLGWQKRKPFGVG
ncbi:MAG: H-X9-DG-CTERM domain-containing protein [Armatimonadaceae bacterium]